MIGEIRRRLNDYIEWNKKCKKEAEIRHDDEAMTFNDNVIFAINKAIDIVDEVEREQL